MTTPSDRSGLDALIPRGGVLSSGYQEIPVDNILPNANQPRKEFDAKELDNLVASVQLVGVLQPIAVRPKGADMFELISGERRWRAAKQIGLELIPAVVKQVDDEDALEQALMENIHRTDLNPLEEAAAYQHLVDEFKLTQDKVAQKVGRSRAAVTNSLRLLKLPVEIQAYVVSGEITAGHARNLVTMENQKEQIRLAKQVVKESWTVRQLEQHRQEEEPSKKSKTKRKKTAKGDQPSEAEREGIAALEDYLANKLNTRVSISMGAKGAPGKAVIEFADLEDLERIVSGMV